MSVYHYGDPHGAPVFFFHGWPSDGTLARLLDEAARKNHLHMIAPDRPGIGGSDAKPGRTLADWPADVRAMAEHYGIGKFAVMGISGGGPYALATAHAMPGRITATAIVCGTPPLDDPGDVAMLHKDFRMLAKMHESHPWFLRFGFRMARAFMPVLPDRALTKSIRKQSAPDRAILADARATAVITGSGRRSFCGTRDGVHDDALIYATPWGFDPARIRGAVEFWHGTEDAIFPSTLTKKLSARIPGAKLHVVTGEGHYSLPINRADEILGALARKMRR